MVSTQHNTYSWTPHRALKVDSDVIERTCRAFNIDPSDTNVQTISDHSGSHPRLSEDNITRLFRCLSERRSKQTARKIARLVERWKEGVKENQSDAFEYESIAKEALQSVASVRYSNGKSNTVTEEEREAYKDLYRVSQAFFSYNYEENMTVYRGVRDLSVAKLFAQALDNTNASSYVIDTSVISNFTATKNVSRRYSTGILLGPPLPRNNAAMMVDHIFATSNPEDEIHVTGGKLFLAPERVIHLGNYTGDERKVQTTSKSLESAEELSEAYLEDIFTILEIMGDNDVGVRTQQGRDKIDNWFTSYMAYATEEEVERLRPMVKYIKRVDKSKNWNY